LRDRIDRLKHSLSASNDSVLIEAGMSPVGTFYSPPSPPSRIRSRTSTPRSSFHENEGRTRLSLRSNDSVGGVSDLNLHHRESSRPRRAYSFELEDGDSPTAALREGIHEAKEAVHQMGDVLDTPRMTPQRRRSPTPRLDLGGILGASPHATETTPSQTSKQSKNGKPYSKQESGEKRKKEKRKDTEKHLDAQNKISYSASSSVSSDSTLSHPSSEVDEEKCLKETNEKPIQISLLSLPSENSTRTLEQTGGSRPPNMIAKFESSGSSMLSSSDESETLSAKAPKKMKTPKDAKISKIEKFEGSTSSMLSSSDESEVLETKVSKKTKTPENAKLSKAKQKRKKSKTPQNEEMSVETNASSLGSPQVADLSEIDSPPVKLETSVVAQIHPKTIASPLTSEVHKTVDERAEHTASSLASISSASTASQARISVDGKPIERLDSIAQTANPRESSKPAKAPESHPLNASSPESTLLGLSSTQEPFSTINMPLLPDDRPTLIQEVAKAREEARKWFTEVTESDRERRELGRRLEALENELIRLKNVEDRYKNDF